MKSDDKQKLSSSWLVCSSKCFHISSSKSPENDDYDDMEKHDFDHMEKSMAATHKKPGGWKAMPFVLGAETFERFASMGLLANFQVFLMTQFHMDQVSASNVIYIWSGVGNFAPLVGAYISDTYAGRFWTIAYASFASLMGMLTFTLIAWIPQLHPPSCTNPQTHQCLGPTKSQIGVLIMALGFMTIGSGGIRPCSIPFGVDQFDSSTEEGRKGINSFFNWFYTSFTVVLIIAFTLVVYIQDSVSWVWGFGIPTMLMVFGIVIFFVGTRVYIYVKPEGSVFSGIAQAIAAAYKKRKLELPNDGGVDGHVLYDPPLKATSVVKKLPLTNQFRCLNKAAIITDGDINPEGTISKPWRLAGIQQIEEVKCLLRVIPIWASGIICFMAMAQQMTFTISQAMKMDRHLGPKFQIPPGSLGVISMITIGLWLPFYDRVFVPRVRKITKIEGGITLLQRMGIGIVFSILAMVAAGLFEIMRRASAVSHGRPDGIAPLSVMYLAPQLILMGFAEAFNILGQIEFYNKEFPENMSSVANSLLACTMAGANYLSSALVNIVHKVTATHDHPDWLTKDINAGKVENFYFIIAAMGVLNLVYFLVVARGYRYKSRVRIDDDDEDENALVDVELNAIKQ